MNIIGLDLSLTGTGIATRTHTYLVKSSGHKGDTLSQRAHRLAQLRDVILDATSAADMVVIEAPSFGSAMGSMHDRSGLWWLIVDALLTRIPVAEVAPTCRAKYATGKGNASKEDVLSAVIRRFPAFTSSNNNEADALVLCAMGYDLIGDPIVEMPAAHRVALTAVAWPSLAAGRGVA